MRELRQNASRYLDRVAAGEVIEITQRGHLVARIVPANQDPWDTLIASGEVIPAADSPADLLKEPPREYGFDGSAELRRLRQDER